MTTESKLLFDWRKAVLSAYGPKSPTTRYVLLALSTYMDVDGGNCFPSQRWLAEMTGLAKRTVNEHLQLAQTEGWIARRLVRRRGRIWHHHAYEPRFPTFLQRIGRNDKVTDGNLVSGQGARPLV